MVVLTRSQSKKQKDQSFVCIYENKQAHTQTHKRKKSKWMLALLIVTMMSILYFQPEVQEHIIQNKEFYGIMYCVLFQIAWTWNKIDRYAMIYGIIYLLHGYGLTKPLMVIIEPLNVVQYCVMFTLQVITVERLLHEVTLIFSLLSLLIVVLFVVHQDYTVEVFETVI